MHGYGEFSWKDRRKYCGFYNNDKKNGFGIHYWPNGEKYYVGFWKDGKQHGPGKYIKGNDMKYGVWNDGKKERWFENENEFINSLNENELKFMGMLLKKINAIHEFMKENL
jgi:hypothetical protein